ncbi:MAG: hypothetical protein II013_02965 [Lachnobacterium sp.]|jgi:hypothetical protein|nr:hypothetical protein [Lachnobacterium sp.]
MESEIFKRANVAKKRHLLGFAGLAILLCAFIIGYTWDIKNTNAHRVDLDKKFISKCKDGNAVKLTITSAPIEVASREGSKVKYSIVENENALYIFEASKDEMKSISKKIDKDGKYVIYGALRKISAVSDESDLENCVVKSLTDMQGKQLIDKEDFNDTFGDYMVENGADGHSLFGDVLIFLMIIDGIVMVIFVFLLYGDRTATKRLAKYSTEELKKIEDEIKDSKTVAIVDNKLYLTPNYLVRASRNLVILPYEDICWIYKKTNSYGFVKVPDQLTIATIEGYFITIPNKMFDSDKEKTKVIDICVENNPNIAVGYDIGKENNYRIISKEMRNLVKIGEDPRDKYIDKNFVELLDKKDLEVDEEDA